MFESELELEKRQSSFGPLILVAVLVLSVVGGLGYFFYQQKRGMTPQEANAAVLGILNERGHASVRFHTGNVVSSVDDRPTDAHYRLLEKAGIVKIGKLGVRSTPVKLTTDGEKKISAFPEYARKTEQDGSVAHVVPLAERKLVAITNVKMLSPSSARVEYTWKWEPNELGTAFDVSGKLMKSFPTWDRAILIEKHGANFYSGEPNKAAVVFVKGASGWKVMQE